MSSEPDRPELEETLRLAARGDEDAWRGIVQQYSPRVFGLIRAQCNNVDLAEEITQSTFCTIVTKLQSYTEVGKFEAWLFRIAMNRLRDEIRRRKRHADPVETSALIGMAGDVDPETADTPEYDESARLREAISTLGETEQMIIHLRHHGGLSFRQIAEVIGEPMGTSLSRHHRSLEKLRQLLEKDST